jgi:hypothetical protein
MRVYGKSWIELGRDVGRKVRIDSAGIARRTRRAAAEDERQQGRRQGKQLPLEEGVV